MCFDEHLHAYDVRHTKNMTLIEDDGHYNEFHELLYLYKFGGKTYVNMRYEMITGNNRF